MEGEKEREREGGEEKESDETEEDAEGAALVWQEGYTEDDLGLPIMHWEALSLRIAELEKQEEERREREKDVGRLTVGWPEEREPGRLREAWEDSEEYCNSRVTALTSRLQSQMNLQLCFINDSESEEEEEEDSRREALQTGKSGRGLVQQSSTPTTTVKAKSGGFRMEVRAALGALRDKLRTEQKRESSPLCNTVTKRKHYEHSDLQNFSLNELKALRTSLSKDIQDLSSDLVGRLLTRDQLRTEQDAMLLEVQDMTSL